MPNLVRIGFAYVSCREVVRWGPCPPPNIFAPPRKSRTSIFNPYLPRPGPESWFGVQNPPESRGFLSAPPWKSGPELGISVKKVKKLRKKKPPRNFFLKLHFNMIRSAALVNIHYQCSLPDPTPSASSLKVNFQISDFDT